MPAVAQRIGDAGDQRRLGPDHDQVRRRSRAQARPPPSGSHGSIATHSAQRAIPGLPGAATSRSQLGDCLSRQASASSRPPEPKSRIFMDLPEDTRAGLLAERRRRRQFAAADASASCRARSSGRSRTAFGRVRVRGEISGFKRHASGHCYFTLKDEDACIDAVIWRGQRGAPRLRARGRRRGHRHRQADHLSRPLQISARHRPAGAGRRGRAAGAAREAPQGARRRRPVRSRRASGRCRSCRAVIGVVTSPTGAVIRDILHRLEDRCPTRVIVWPVPVQGEGAAAKVAAAIRGFADASSRGPTC